jgi:hypothetical protein
LTVFFTLGIINPLIKSALPFFYRETAAFRIFPEAAVFIRSSFIEKAFFI